MSNCYISAGWDEHYITFIALFPAVKAFLHYKWHSWWPLLCLFNNILLDA